MAKILAFAGSNSSTSINFKLIKTVSADIQDHPLQLLNMVNYPFPMYSEDYEREHGYSNSLVELRDDIESAAGLLIAVNEHNGLPSAYFKNLIDWLSRVDRKLLTGKQVYLLATSTGKGGGSSALRSGQALLERLGAEVVARFSLPSFHDNFDGAKGITNASLKEGQAEKLQIFLSKL